ncbi:hypothetical protein [Bergeriella denitrificans]|uniref:Integral membrane protein n=1 Tax=Bergeriella denitrificans TaxID=494 RepID=A0A378UK65_BERDE|nr:hypothetical protein [Bergeriella denitrificans]STZ77049.1 integral membrane protein [Bergeriella denitrificans]
MWHIVVIGYLFVAIMFSVAQPSIARMVVYLLFWAVLPTVFVCWVVLIRRRNKRLKAEEDAADGARTQQD